jgi:hypothetical protein
LGDIVDALLETSKEVALEKSKHMVMPRHQNAGQNQNVLMVSKALEMWQSSSIWEQQ